MNEPQLNLAQEIFDEINQHTLPGDGITRPSYSAEETAAMRVVERYAQEFGFKTSWDGVANLHCVLDGGSGKEIATGSHLDSVPRGGRYDGVAGVVAGLMAMRLRSLSAAPRHPLRLIVFRGEESAWFGKCYLGSLGLFGLLTADDLRRRSMQDQETLGRRIAHRGGFESYAGSNSLVGTRMPESADIGRFIEVHIEQGPVLHELNEPVGIVNSIRGNHRYAGALISGEPGHSGTTPNRLRRDAVLAFADLIHRLERGAQVFGEELVMTCGVAGTDPAKHATTIIPDAFHFNLEFRSGNQATLELFDDFYRATTESVLAQRKLPGGLLGVRTVTRPEVMDPSVCRDLRRHAQHVLDQEDVTLLPSGAGHDAAVFARMGIPTGMIFIRNDHGSHNPDESMDMKDFMLATGILYRAMGGT